MVRAADLVSFPGIKKAPKKRIAAILEPPEEKLGEENGDDAVEDDDEENTSDTEDQGNVFFLCWSTPYFIITKVLCLTSVVK